MGMFNSTTAINNGHGCWFKSVLAWYNRHLCRDGARGHAAPLPPPRADSATDVSKETAPKPFCNITRHQVFSDAATVIKAAEPRSAEPRGRGCVWVGKRGEAHRDSSPQTAL